MRQKIHKTIVTMWLIVGLLLCLWGFEELYKISKYEGPSGGAFQATLISEAFAAMIIASAVGALRRRLIANRFLISTYAIGIIYAAVFVLLGGFEDTGLLYSICVALLSIISMTGIVVACSKAVRSEYYAPNKPLEPIR
jgi:hypothetical protein